MPPPPRRCRAAPTPALVPGPAFAGLGKAERGGERGWKPAGLGSQTVGVPGRSAQPSEASRSPALSEESALARI